MIWQIVEAKGIRLDWLARQLDISPSYVSRLKNGDRRWTEALKARAAQVFGLPEDVLFPELEQVK